MIQADTSRRRFLAYFSGAGLSTTLLPGALWSRMQEQEALEVTAAMVLDAAAVSGLELSAEQAEAMVEGVNRNLRGYGDLQQVAFDPNVAPPLHFSALVPGAELDRERRPFRTTEPTGVRRPTDLETVAFWPLTHLAALVRERQVTSLELTEMYLSRLERMNGALNCVVTLTPGLAREQARAADAEIASGNYRGLLHGIPWGAKDILAVRGYPTTWGSEAFRTQVFDYDATVVRRLADAGAVLVAKLTTGELAGGDRWFGGRTRNPWDSTKGSSGSSAGPASATVAGCVAFALGTETSGSILSPSVACGASGLRPTFGRVSRYGSMTLRWSGDRIGPICRTVEDCAVVFSVISGPDPQDPSVLDLPFNWDAAQGLDGLRVAYLPEAFDDDPRKGEDWKANDRRALDRLRSQGLDLIPLPTPLRDYSTDVLRPMSVESAAAFDTFLRSGRESELGRPGRAVGWRVNSMVPAVAYLQAQRARYLMMVELHEALREIDVVVAPYGDARRSLSEPPPEGGGGGGGGTGAPPRRSATSQFFQLANHATLPAVAVRHGFGDDGLPTGITFVGRPFQETDILRVAKAYQDATDFHLRTPMVAQ